MGDKARAMPHGGVFGAPEDAEMLTGTRRFVAQYWGKPQGSSSPPR
jgi:hypothetical protein